MHRDYTLRCTPVLRSADPPTRPDRAGWLDRDVLLGYGLLASYVLFAASAITSGPILWELQLYAVGFLVVVIGGARALARS
jgi:hypothetical protein